VNGVNNMREFDENVCITELRIVVGFPLALL
jgi:hypothetical protein